MTVEKIVIKCQGADVIDIDKLTEFQGDLKDLPDENYQRLKDDILTLGFADPINVWSDDPEKRNPILDGHQRLKTLQKMKTEGFEIPLIPVNWVQADSYENAKKLVLSLTSQFGVITGKGLANFIKESNLRAEEVISNFRR